jgi:[protein-PII] uridylyltransferase
LYLLTIADITGTNPKLWNSWKDRLLADLYVAARYVLRRDLERPPRAEIRVHDTRERTLALLAAQGYDADASARTLDRFPDQALLRERAESLAWQTAAMQEAPLDATVVAVRSPGLRGGTEVFVATPDRDRVFAAIVTTLGRLGLDIVAARVMTSRAGRALDTLTVLEEGTQAPIAMNRTAGLRAALREVLADSSLRVRPARRGLTRRLRHFQRPPRIDFHPIPGRPMTRLALVCSDRPGLLVSIAQAFLDADVRVRDARIATFGDRVEDFFELTDRHDRPLSAVLQQSLRQALQRQLDPGSMTAGAELKHA